MVSIATEEYGLTVGLTDNEAARLRDALDFVRPIYSGKPLRTGQDAMEFSEQVALVLSQLSSDADTRIAALLFQLHVFDPDWQATIEKHFGHELAEFVGSIQRLMRLHEMTFGQQEQGAQEGAKTRSAQQAAAAQVEALRKMLLAMASDMRAVLVRLASRLTTLRYFADNKVQNELSERYARETFDLYAPLANRLGIWQLKWELEDLSFRFVQPDAYKRVARMLEERRLEREAFVANAIQRLKTELERAGIKADVYGRPKHIYSIWSKMHGKSLDFSELHDVRALRVIVDDVRTCYAALGIIHNIWTPIPKEFDDYISRPKPNGYQSLHTVVVGEDGRALEVQVRTRDMHHFAEYGVAAHWRYKETGGGSTSQTQKYDEKIAWLRQLLAWKSEVVDHVVDPDDMRRQWVDRLKSATLDDHIYVLTPQARVIELPAGATPIDFAYHLHSDIGHRCRGARIDGVMVPLNTQLKNGQTVEIITAKGEQVAAGAAGPSRDWLSPGYAASPRTRAKIRAWFNAVEQQETLAAGRALIEKTLQREGKTAVKLDELAQKLGFAKTDELFLAVGKDQFSLRHVEQALQEGRPKEVNPDDAVVARKSRASSVAQGAKAGVLVVGTEGLLTQLARCCKPAPGDPIVGFVTRGKGVSIHRATCKNFAQMKGRAAERVIDCEWGASTGDTVYPVDISVQATDRQGLLRDISDVFLREKINVIGVNTYSSKGEARMEFTAEISSTAQLQRALTTIREVKGVHEARRV